MMESKFQSEFIKFLRKKYNDDIYVVRYYSDPIIGESGHPDVMLCYKGKFVGVELKTTSKANPLQLQRLKQIKSAGGHGIVFTHSKEWKDRISEIIEGDGVFNGKI